MSEYRYAEARFDWAQYADRIGAVRAVRGRSDEYVIDCPDCQKPKLAINVSRRAWRCFTCGDGGRDATSLIAKAEQIPWHRALIEVLGGNKTPVGSIDRLCDFVKPSAAKPWIPKPIPWPESFSAFNPSYSVSNSVFAYLERRRIPIVVAERMGLGSCTVGRFRNRLIFPVFDSGGRLIFYQGRAMWDPRPGDRYIKTLSIRSMVDETGNQITAGSSDCLLNLRHVIDNNLTRIAVTEGPIDCAHAWPDAVCTFGKQISGKQVELLVRAGVSEIDLCYDADAIAAMEKIAPLLSDLFVVRIIRFPDGTDPGDWSKEKIDQLRSVAPIWGEGYRLSQISVDIR